MTSTDINASELENSGLEYVQVESNEELSLSNFAQYALLPSEEGDILSVSSVNDQNDRAWHELSSMELPTKNDDPLSFLSTTELSMLQELDRLIKLERATPPCQGEGDGPNNCLSTPREKIGHLEENVANNEVEQFCNEGDENDRNQINYTTLESAKTVQSCINFETPQLSCQFKKVFPDDSRGSPVMLPWQNSVGPEHAVSLSNVMPQYQMLKTPIMTPFVVRHPIYKSSYSGNSSVGLSFNSSSSYSNSSVQDSDTSSDCPKPPNNTPTCAKDEDGSPTTSCRKRAFSASELNCKLGRLTQNPSFDERETHNAKERERRSRIRDSCQSMRKLLPGINDRTDNATIFEQFANYIAFLKAHVDPGFDRSYLKHFHLWQEKTRSETYLEE